MYQKNHIDANTMSLVAYFFWNRYATGNLPTSGLDSSGFGFGSLNPLSLANFSMPLTILSALSRSPCRTSHLGDSGSLVLNIIATTAITPPSTNSSLHPITKFGTRARAMNGVIAWPIIPMRNVRTDILPLFPGGASSPMYVETRLRSAPTPIPVRNLHSASVTIPVEVASPRIRPP